MRVARFCCWLDCDSSLAGASLVMRVCSDGSDLQHPEKLEHRPKKLNKKNQQKTLSHKLCRSTKHSCRLSMTLVSRQCGKLITCFTWSFHLLLLLLLLPSVQPHPGQAMLEFSHLHWLLWSPACYLPTTSCCNLLPKGTLRWGTLKRTKNA